MENTDKKRRRPLKLRFNIIDLLLIIIIICSVAGMYILIRQSGNSDTEESVEITYKIIVKNMREEFRNLVSVGDSVTDAVSLCGLGEVVDVTYSESQYIGVNRVTGEFVYGSYPAHLDMTLTVRANGIFSGGLYLVNGYDIGVGGSIDFRVPEFTASGCCSAVSVQ